MATTAWFMINVAEKFRRYGRQEVVRDLQAMPEVKSVDVVGGLYDLVVEVEAPLSVVLVANKIMAKEWVKRLDTLVEKPLELDRHKSTTGDLVKYPITSVSQNQTSSPPLL